jgi:hypothetical protein
MHSPFSITLLAKKVGVGKSTTSILRSADLASIIATPAPADVWEAGEAVAERRLPTQTHSS